MPGTRPCAVRRIEPLHQYAWTGRAGVMMKIRFALAAAAMAGAATMVSACTYRWHRPSAALRSTERGGGRGGHATPRRCGVGGPADARGGAARPARRAGRGGRGTGGAQPRPVAARRPGGRDLRRDAGSGDGAAGGGRAAIGSLRGRGARRARAAARRRRGPAGARARADRGGRPRHRPGRLRRPARRAPRGHAARARGGRLRPPPAAGRRGGRDVHRGGGRPRRGADR